MWESSSLTTGTVQPSCNRVAAQLHNDAVMIEGLGAPFSVDGPDQGQRSCRYSNTLTSALPWALPPPRAALLQYALGLVQLTS